jgi:hypothetical protein
MSGHEPKQATREELTSRCGHECLKEPDHDGTHFYGYICGPYSYEGLVARVEELEAELAEIVPPDEETLADLAWLILDTLHFAPDNRDAELDDVMGVLRRTLADPDRGAEASPSPYSLAQQEGRS